jgi:hypothetical protein
MPRLNLQLRGPSAIHGVQTPDQYEQWHRLFVQHNAPGGKTFDRADTVSAYVNDGRWCADCPNCNGGMAAWPGWSSRCGSCGAVYASVAFPSNAEAVEEVLAVRPVRHQNWSVGEPMERLVSENVERSLPVPALLDPAAPPVRDDGKV